MDFKLNLDKIKIQLSELFLPCRCVFLSAFKMLCNFRSDSDTEKTTVFCFFLLYFNLEFSWNEVLEWLQPSENILNSTIQRYTSLCIIKLRFKNKKQIKFNSFLMILYLFFFFQTEAKKRRNNMISLFRDGRGHSDKEPCFSLLDVLFI